MTSLIHKAKDVVTGHHHSEDKGASQGSSILTDKTNDTPNTDPYAAIGHGIHHDSVSSTAKETLTTHGSISAMSGNIDPTATDTSKHDMGSHNSGVIHDFTCSATDVGSPAMSSTGSDTHRSRIIHAGPHGSKMANKLDRRMDSDLDHRKAPAGNRTTSSHQMGTYRSNYDTAGTTAAGSIPTLRASRSTPLGSHPPAHDARSVHTDMGNNMNNHEEPSLPNQKA